MGKIKVGDIVTRKSHNHDIMFKIVRLDPKGQAELKGLHLRLKADAPLHDLIAAGKTESLATARERMLRARKHVSMRKSMHMWRPAGQP